MAAIFAGNHYRIQLNAKKEVNFVFVIIQVK